MRVFQRPFLALLPAFAGCHGNTDVVADLLVDAGEPRGTNDPRGNSQADGSMLDVSREPDAMSAGAMGATDGETVCLGELAARAFQFALCSCADTVFENGFTTDGFDSATGPYGPESQVWDRSSVGTNGSFRADTSLFTIGGSLIVADAQGLSFPVAATILEDLRVAGPLSLFSLATVGGDLWLAGDAKGTGYMIVAGDLIQTAGAQRDPLAVFAVSGADRRESLVTVLAPCPCGEDAVDIPALSRVGKLQAQNAEQAFAADNAADASAERRIELPAGWISVSSVDVASPLTLVVGGKTALFVEGDLRARGGFFTIELAPDAELDLVVGGNFEVANEGRFGDSAHPAAVRAYVAGEQTIVFSSEMSLAANLYAPHADVRFLGSQPDLTPLGADLFGAILARNIDVDVGFLHYDSAIARTRGGCPP